jgi:hypothetical protein
MPHLLIIGSVWPEPTSSAAGVRMMQLIEVFLQANYTLTFASTCAKTDNAVNLESLGVAQQEIQLNHASFDDFITRLQPNMVLFDRFMTEEQFGWRVAQHCPNALRILDTEDLHCLRNARAQAFKKEIDFTTNALLQTDIAKREIASVLRCDVSLIISEVEMQLLTEVFRVDKALLLYIPFMLDEVTDEIAQKLPSFNSRQHFITIGNFLHAPNLDAVRYLKTTIWPLIRKQLPKAQLHIYGAYVSQKATQLHNEKEGFLIQGKAKNVHTVIQQAKVCLAPLRFGAGLKGKLVDAMQNGTPCVMSTIAAEGMFGELPPNGIVANTPQDFANAAVALYNNEPQWEDAQQQGYAVINQRFSKEKYKTTLLAKLQELQEQLDTHRTNNFIGAMLQHHTLQSTKFMARWIEEKNKS